jgi:hypothetical protein
MEYSFCNKRALAQKLGCSHHTIKAFRQRGELIENIHYIRSSPRSILYNLELCLNWLANRHSPASHRKAIEQYLASLEEASKTRKLRKT